MQATKNEISVQELKRKGYPIVSPHEVIPKSWFKGKEVSLKKAQKCLSKIKGSMAEDIADIREESY